MRTRIIRLNPDSPDINAIKESAEALRQGRLVVFPTETVYGIGANYLDAQAVNRLRMIKKRPRNKPFTIHIAGFDTLKTWKLNLSKDAKSLIQKFWPGPLTILVFNKDGKKLGFRMPRNKIALTLISQARVPVVAPSANISGRPPLVSGEKVVVELDGVVDVILDSGVTELGIESTVLDVTVTPFTVVRQGAISEKELFCFRVLFVCTGNSCRSVMAQSIMDKLLKESGLSDKVCVDSAGTGAYDGIPVASNTVEVMKEEGIDVSTHKGKGIDSELLRKSDIIFVMERMHKDILADRVAGIEAKIRFLMEDEDIPDPIGKPIEEYRRVRNIIKDQVENIFLELFKKESRDEGGDRSGSRRV